MRSATVAKVKSHATSARIVDFSNFSNFNSSFCIPIEHSKHTSIQYAEAAAFLAGSTAVAVALPAALAAADPCGRCRSPAEGARSVSASGRQSFSLLSTHHECPRGDGTRCECGQSLPHEESPRTLQGLPDSGHG